ncbi:MAG: flagellar biosynthetic protein FliP, partial [Candidatus Zixiibacteriota bacterium]
MYNIIRTILLCGAVLFILTGSTAAQTLPKVSVQVGEAGEPSELSTTLQIVILMTVLALAPSILIMVTSFIRFTVVLSFLRNAMGIHQAPPNQLLVALALILTFFVMAPVMSQSYDQGIKPFLDKQISKEEAFG